MTDGEIRSNDTVCGTSTYWMGITVNQRVGQLQSKNNATRKLEKERKKESEITHPAHTQKFGRDFKSH